MLRYQGTHQKTAVACALDGQFLRLRILSLHHVPQDRGKVVENILLVCQAALFVPLLAKLAAAPQVRNRIHNSLVKQHLRVAT